MKRNIRSLVLISATVHLTSFVAAFGASFWVSGAQALPQSTQELAPKADLAPAAESNTAPASETSVQKVLQKSNRKSNQASNQKSTDVSFDEALVQGRYHFSDEAVTTVEEDKVLDALLGVRTNFKDRLKKSAARH